MRARPWNSENWLRRQFVTLGKTMEQIAKDTGCSEATIRRKLKEFQIIK